MTAVAVHLLVPCPACEGNGEIWVSGDPRGPNLETRACWGCLGETEVASERAEEIRDVIANPPEWDGP